MLKVELESMEEMVRDKRSYIERMEDELIRIDERKGELEDAGTILRKRLKEISDEKERWEGELEDRVELLSRLKGEKGGGSKEISTLQITIENLREEMSSRRESLAAVKAKLEDIQSVGVNSYGVDIIGYTCDDDELAFADEEEISKEIERVRLQLSQMGEVNIGAIEEREELQERYDNLVRQKDDLEKSMKDLQTVISKIDRESKERFNTTFHQINEKFSELFPKLFMGGRGYLELLNEEDMSEPGVEIIPHPPGKRLRNLSLLSNGEKALTGICLLLSLFFIRPGPFLFLDEVDAPLDEANVDRFNRLIRKISGSCQVVMITHKKRTMELADYLYGITMERPGISRVVSAKIV
jgi:chromosome segregation protein